MVSIQRSAINSDRYTLREIDLQSGRRRVLIAIPPPLRTKPHDAVDALGGHDVRTGTLNSKLSGACEDRLLSAVYSWTVELGFWWSITVFAHRKSRQCPPAQERSLDIP